MAFPRLPRFKRAPTFAPMRLTERDHEIIRLVHRHRFLRSSHIMSLIGDSPQQILRRLQLLYHHGYVDRPRQQIDYYHRGGSVSMVYRLGNNGGAILKPELEAAFRPLLAGEHERSIGRVFLEHALLVSDVMVAIELACRRARIRFLTEDELRRENGRTAGSQPFRWKVNISGGINLSVIPDRVFALEREDQGGNRNRAIFFLEADRGTMPVMRGNLSQTSFFRKLLAYEATWSQDIHRTRFGFNRFRVLTVTTSAMRIDSLVGACSHLKRGHGLFLFADWKSMEKAEDMFSLIWQTGTRGETASLLP
jgi:hypothetical protein